MDNKLTTIEGAYSPTCPADCSVYNNGCFYIRYGQIIEFYISIKMENVIQTGYAGRKAITLNMLYANRARNNIVFFASDGLGDTKPVECELSNDILTIFPATTGTTYAIGCVTYVANE